jgi:hypothetical protein
MRYGIKLAILAEVYMQGIALIPGVLREIGSIIYNL